MKVTAIIPCYSRIAQTMELIPRLQGSAGMDASEWELIAVVQGQPELAQKLQNIRGIRILNSKTNLGYWGALRIASQKSTSPLLANLSNDLLPGMDWLKRAVDAFTLTYPDGEGMIGFNDGIRVDQSAHFLISRSLLHRWYGDDMWPVVYKHGWGDSEICKRAKQERKFAIAPFSVLYHNHPMIGANADEVYTLGGESFEQDAAVYELRRANKWSSTPLPKGG